MLTEIIKIFKEKSDYVSGEEMSKKLGITRAAIWKKVKELRRKGYVIKGSSAKGYRLIKTPEFSAEELRMIISPESFNKGEFIGRELVFLESVDSTNTFAMELAEKGSPHGTIVIADKQTKGKGRLGRTWVSPPKSNIYMSAIMRPEIGPKDATLLTVMAAVACAEGIKNSSGLDVRIKWPNDLVVYDKKLGGILTEMKSDPDRILFAVVGIGINVNAGLRNFPPDIRDTATSVKKELGKAQSRTAVVAEILKSMNRWHDILAKEGKRPLIEEWKRRLTTLGRKVRVFVGSESLTGIAEDVDGEGLLILRLPSGAARKISSGDVTMLR